MTYLIRHYKIMINIIRSIFQIVFLLILLPLFIILICPIYIIRFIVLLISKIMRPDLVTILGVRDMFYGVDKITSNPKSSVVVTMICKGKTTRRMLMRNIHGALNKRQTRSKNLLYPELTMYLVKFLGFIFWKQDTSFSLENHVTYVDLNKYFINNPPSKNKHIDEELVKELEKKLVQEPFLHERSPWECKILQHYEPKEFMKSKNDNNQDEEYTCLFFKIHHSFIDGYSLLNLLMKDIMKSPKETSKANFKKRSQLQEMLLYILLCIKAPFDTLSEVFMKKDNNPWHLTKDKVTNEINSAVSHRISSKKIKDIANQSHATFTSLIISSISGGIRRHMKERGEDPDNSSFSTLAPFPVPGHPETLGNYLSDCYVEFPIRIANSTKRLQYIEGELQKLKNSTASLSSFVMQPIFGGLFHWMIQPLVDFSMSKSTGIFSSFPGPKAYVSAPSGDIIDAYFTCGHDSPGIGIQFLAFNYAGGWKLKIQADKGTLASDHDVEILLGHILDELNDYESECIV